jgi:alpha-1,2-mannosyltransferase
VSTAARPDASAWLASAASWLTPQRIRAHAILLALCLWGVCAIDFATPDLFDRVGNIKFQDFLPFFVSAQLVAQGRATELYDQNISAEAIQQIVHRPAGLTYLYGPQVALGFVPLAQLSFPAAARIWVALSLLIFVACIYLLWRACLSLRPYRATVFVAALAFPPLYHLLVRGQISALILACFTAAFFAFRANHAWLAGVALGLMVFKPQFLVAIPFILVLSGAWRAFTGLALSALAQLALARIYFGSTVMLTYFDTLLHSSRWISTAEPGQAQIQMHSLRSFWSLLIPWPELSNPLYLLTSVVVIALATAVWKSSHPLALRFSALVLAAVLVNPHLFVYDLLVLAPAVMLLADWALTNLDLAATRTLPLLLYLVFISSLLGPLSRWTHLQLSVPLFVALLWFLWNISTSPTSQASPQLPLSG